MTAVIIFILVWFLVALGAGIVLGKCIKWGMGNE